MSENKKKTEETNVVEQADGVTVLEAKLAALEAKLAELDGEKESSHGEGAALRDISTCKDDDLVELTLFCDGDRYKDDVFVGINGVMCQIKRGVPIRLKRSFAKVIAASERMSAAVNAEMAAADGNYKKLSS